MISSKDKRFNRKPVSNWLGYAGKEHDNRSVKQKIINFLEKAMNQFAPPGL
jgi:hypothetical protein